MKHPHHYTQEHLRTLTPEFPTFVGIDSDGCIFPTMEIKQKECFHPLIIRYWNLEPIASSLREVAEFVNLYSCYRGQNRFTALLKTFELLSDHPEVRRQAFPPPPLEALRDFCNSGRPLSNPSLQTLAEETRAPELQRLLIWSLSVNREIAEKVTHVAPFKGVVESLDAIHRQSDAICVSQTPTEALVREWEEHDLLRYVRVIAGQELGTKAEHLTLATRGRYPADRVLMIGDAPGDLKAARAVGARFFPINPGREEGSWTLFLEEAYPRFLEDRYDPAYEAECVRIFTALLPDTPPWATPA